MSPIDRRALVSAALKERDAGKTQRQQPQRAATLGNWTSRSCLIDIKLVHSEAINCIPGEEFYGGHGVEFLAQKNLRSWKPQFSGGSNRV